MSTAQEVVEESANASQPTASPLPIRPGTQNEASRSPSRPQPTPKLPRPRLMFEVRDVSHPGAAVFFEHVNPLKILSDAQVTVLQILYQHRKSSAKLDMPPIRSITLILKPMDGVAYTTSKDFDNDHKEIHLSLDYVSSIPSEAATRQAEEIHGVLVHEMVHVWQHDGKGTCPGGLVEGIADFVRLKAGYVPPHWTRKPGPEWDAGYQATGYFLEWIEKIYGSGKVGEINLKLKEKYEEKTFWKQLIGEGIEECFKKYCNEMGHGSNKEENGTTNAKY